ncbi:hypothetical protein BJ508DRAFT_312731 [Ascobolus immersus RN42]|uniref:Uncharacterized protein n=1 Tax=Ascobolus immersus RN42 TaxID=1160509 RepID=A0A3N4HL66_ASCIM|nr:hypothetical protein BJ508DRAFT_312731 [Ascobolus immersus RN42]
MIAINASFYHPRDEYIFLLRVLACERSTLQRKWEAGLLRDRLLRLVIVVLAKLIHDIGELLPTEEPVVLDLRTCTDTRFREELPRITTLMRIINRARIRVEFLAALRVERVEILLERYLNQEVVVENVIEGLEMSQRRWEDAVSEGEWFQRCVLEANHYNAKYHHYAYEGWLNWDKLECRWRHMRDALSESPDPVGNPELLGDRVIFQMIHKHDETCEECDRREGMGQYKFNLRSTIEGPAGWYIPLIHH